MKKMKMKMNKYLLLALCLGSCYTPNKANKELNKANNKYPQLVAKFTREKFPCITKSADTLTTTDTLYQYVDVQCPDTTSQTDTIYLDKVKTKTIKKLVAIPQQTRIINHYIEDSAKIKVMAYENEQCDTKLKKEADKAETRLKWSMRLLIALIISMLLNIILFKKTGI
jgi:hypothetical protein